MRKGLFLIGLMMITMAVGMVRADEYSPKPGTAEDNECYPGGVLYREENQDGCPSVWYWKAGWYLARYNRGLISRADFPKEFESVLPPLSDGSVCWHNSSQSVKYIGPPDERGNTLFYYSSLDCSGPVSYAPGGSAFVVFASNPSDAIPLCAAKGTIVSLEHLNTIGYANAPSNAYGCTVV